MNLLSRSLLPLLTALSLVACASVPSPATRGPNSPASSAAPESPIQKPDLFTPVTAMEPSPEAAATMVDHSKMDQDTYTCIMHEHIAEAKPGKCPICGMALVKKAKEKK